MGSKIHGPRLPVTRCQRVVYKIGDSVDVREGLVPCIRLGVDSRALMCADEQHKNKMLPWRLLDKAGYAILYTLSLRTGGPPPLRAICGLFTHGAIPSSDTAF